MGVARVLVQTIPCSCWGVDEEEISDVGPAERIGSEWVSGFIRRVGSQAVGSYFHGKSDDRRAPWSSVEPDEYW